MKAALRNKRPVPDDSKLPILTMNKKAIMLKFLITVVLAIFIFIPACAFVTKFFFRLSAQGEDSFRDLVNEVKDVAEAAEGEQRTFVLKMDAETVVVASRTGTVPLFSLQVGTGLTPFPSAIKKDERFIPIPDPLTIPFFRNSEGATGINFLTAEHIDVGYYFSSQQPQCQSASCLCLCKEITSEPSEVTITENPLTGDVVTGNIYLSCVNEDLTCRDMPSVDFQESWSIIRFEEKDPRRIPLRITKEAGKVVIEELS